MSILHCTLFQEESQYIVCFGAQSAIKLIQETASSNRRIRGYQVFRSYRGQRGHRGA